ncbi:DNA polymerase [Rhodovulum sp. PH10]|uniref:nucleotidyltransferase family protein n=1 Tax=Rhodovulum sp. PH10 TaxID=1187851 RepID=UPI00027C256C|nr:nucleotidyltransferase family protein [Rhodovulum sp. PH10]EJW10810.1 DNA polymerase [Rhodovulum sp. PH10]
MERAEAIARLTEVGDVVRARGATSLWLFGATARDEATAGSDLDLFIDYDPAKKFSLVDLVGLEESIESRLGTRVDLPTRDSLHPRLRDDIVRSAVRVL